VSIQPLHALPDPTDSQWEAIRTTDSHLLVAAGAGTGKTFTVVQKVVYLLGVRIRQTEYTTPLQLRDIAAITFTNRAAAELKNDLREALRLVGRRADAYKVDAARVGTIHSFCGDILREFALRSGRPPKLALLADAESLALRDEVVREALLAALEDRTIEGLPELLTERSVSDVEKWTRDLLNQGDHLRALVARASSNTPAERALLGLASQASRLLEERLSNAAQMDFDRMIVWTRDLIRDDATVRKALQRRIRVLIIDEFQDVDPVQREIAYLLGEPTTRRKDTSRLVLVGDPKQSIYRFRKADVTVWRTAERDFSSRGCGRIVALAESRRSVAPILGFVDHAIGGQLDKPVDPTKELQDFEVPYAPLVAQRTDGLADRAVEFITIPAKDDGKPRRIESIRRIEARAVARRARELHDQGVEWRDMAVLLCGWGAVEIYGAALSAEGIPAYALRSEGYYTRREVVDMILALEAIRDPQDDRALLGFLRSPFVGLTDESLLSIVRQVGNPCWTRIRDVKLGDPEEQAILDRGIKLVARLSAIRDRVPIAELLNELLDESAYVAHLVLLGEDGRQRIANVRKFVRIAAASHEASVGGFLDVVKRDRKLEVLEGDARLHGERDNVVTVTSVHMAKGLEWDVVFWSDLARRTWDESTRLLIGRETVALGEPEVEGKDQPPGWQAIKLQLEQESTAESKRLWYVASTRARNRLILTGVPLGSTRWAGSPAGIFKEMFPGLESGTLSYTARDGRKYAAVVRMAEVVEESEDAATDRVETLRTVGDVTLLAAPMTAVSVPAGRMRHSATELLTHERCGRRHWFKYVVGLREPRIQSGGGSTEETSAIRRGLIVHDVLERYEAEAELDGLLEDAIGRWDPDAPAASDGSRGRRYREELTTEVRAVLDRPEYQDLVGRAGARRELAFLHVVGPGVSIEGKIDVVAPAPGGYEILDVKTSKCDEEVARKKAERYALQKDAYVRSVEEISGRQVETFRFQFSGPAIQVSEKIGEAERTAALVRLERAAGAVRRGERGLTEIGAECQFCGYRAVGWCAGVAIPTV
jgi:ATP-dependent helicase/nuclease subunit A